MSPQFNGGWNVWKILIAGRTGSCHKLACPKGSDQKNELCKEHQNSPFALPRQRSRLKTAKFRSTETCRARAHPGAARCIFCAGTWLCLSRGCVEFAPLLFRVLLATQGAITHEQGNQSTEWDGKPVISGYNPKPTRFAGQRLPGGIVSGVGHSRTGPSPGRHRGWRLSLGDVDSKWLPVPGYKRPGCYSG